MAGLEPANTRVKVSCLNQLGHTPTAQKQDIKILPLLSLNDYLYTAISSSGSIGAFSTLVRRHNLLRDGFRVLLRDTSMLSTQSQLMYDYMVRMVGFEPTRLKPTDFKSVVYAVPPHSQEAEFIRYSSSINISSRSAAVASLLRFFVIVIFIELSPLSPFSNRILFSRTNLSKFIANTFVSFSMSVRASLLTISGLVNSSKYASQNLVNFALLADIAPNNSLASSHAF